MMDFSFLKLAFNCRLCSTSYWKLSCQCASIQFRNEYFDINSTHNFSSVSHLQMFHKKSKLPPSLPFSPPPPSTLSSCCAIHCFIYLSLSVLITLSFFLGILVLLFTSCAFFSLPFPRIYRICHFNVSLSCPFNHLFK